MVSFTVRHLSTNGTVLAGRGNGDVNGIVRPMRLHFELRTSYTVDEHNGTEPSVMDVLFPSEKYDSLNYVPNWEHHRFYGWYTTAATPSQLEDTSGRRLTPNESIVYDIKTVYARWQLPATVSFDATTGGGTMPGGWTAPDYYVGQPFGILPEPTKAGEVFLGWFTSDGTRITESFVVPSGTVALTARYQAVNYATKLEVQPTSSYKKFGIHSTTAMDSSAPTVVDWGDGTYDVIYGNVSQLVHEYATTGTYEVSISDSITSIGISINDSTWYNNTSQVRYTLKKVKTLSSNVTTYTAYAFYYCSAMTDVLFPSSASFTSIPTYCFYYCTSLKNVTIPSMVTTISSYAFAYCQGVVFNTITIPGKITSIGSYAFYYCYYLTNVTFESSETALSLGTYAFAYCGYYSKFDIDLSPRIITSIPNYCFYYCRYLGTVTFPRNCTSIGNYAFYHAWDQSGVGSPTFTIPEGITSIGQYAFAHTYYLAEITIPSTCSTINNYTFYYAQRLATITCNRTTAPTVYSSTFGNSNTYYTGRSSYSAGTNKLIVQAGATGYTSSYWADPLCNSSKCGFHIEYGGTEVTITFDATTNGGQMPSGWVPPTYYEGVPYGTLPTPTKTGEMFAGWYDGDTLVTTSSIVPVGGVTLVARYAEMPYLTDGAVAMWDGTWNVGINNHSDSTSTWTDLIGQYPLTTNRSTNGWESDGYVFDGTYCFYNREFNNNIIVSGWTAECVYRLDRSMTDYKGIFGSRINGVWGIYGLNYWSDIGGYNCGIGAFTDAFPANTFSQISELTSLNTIHYMALTYNPGVSMELYHNGVLLGTKSFTSRIASTSAGYLLGAAYLDSGDFSSSVPNRIFNGKVFAHRLYNKVLTSSEIATNYAVDRQRFNLS